jgi:ribonuclease Z
MSAREFIALGTSSQVPTKERNHNAYLLRWDGQGFLFDPGEGAQRQLAMAGVAASAIHFICITHFHGDHCLGLTGVVQRLSLDRCDHPVHLFFPEDGRIFIERLCSTVIYYQKADLRMHPVAQKPGAMMDLFQTEFYSLKAHSLDHSVPTIGFRLEESTGSRFLPEKLDQAGIYGPMVGELKRNGSINVGDRVVRLEEVTTSRPGSVFAFIMDTKPCPGAAALANDADLIVMEATYTAGQKELADQYLHSTALDAAKVAQTAGAQKLALTHFSQRYQDSGQHIREAKGIFPDVIALNDFDCIPIPRRNAAHSQPISRNAV